MEQRGCKDDDIHIWQNGEVRTALSTAIKQNHTKLSKRIQVLD